MNTNVIVWEATRRTGSVKLWNASTRLVSHSEVATGGSSARKYKGPPIILHLRILIAFVGFTAGAIVAIRLAPY